jgi:hypothetical protein
VSALIRAELLKVRTTRGWYAYLVVLVLLSGFASAADVGSSEDFLRGTLEFQVGLVEAAGFAGLLALILGITAVTVEFRHGTVTPTFLTTPVRERVLAAKAVAVALVALLFFLVSLVVIAAVAVTWLTIVDAQLHLGSGELWERIGETALGAVLWGLIGVAIGSVVHSQVAALVGTLIWIFVVENLLWALLGWRDLDGVASYLPFRALDAADGTGGEDLLSYGGGVAVSLGWIAALGTAGVLRTRRRDIT